MNYVECETLLTTVISNVIANASKKILYFDFLCAYNITTTAQKKEMKKSFNIDDDNGNFWHSRNEKTYQALS